MTYLNTIIFLIFFLTNELKMNNYKLIRNTSSYLEITEFLKNGLKIILR